MILTQVSTSLIHLLHCAWTQPRGTLKIRNLIELPLDQGHPIVHIAYVHVMNESLRVERKERSLEIGKVRSRIARLLHKTEASLFNLDKGDEFLGTITVDTRRGLEVVVKRSDESLDLGFTLGGD